MNKRQPGTRQHDRRQQQEDQGLDESRDSHSRRKSPFEPATHRILAPGCAKREGELKGSCAYCSDREDDGGEADEIHRRLRLILINRGAPATGKPQHKSRGAREPD